MKVERVHASRGMKSFGYLQTAGLIGNTEQSQLLSEKR